MCDRSTPPRKDTSEFPFLHYSEGSRWWVELPCWWLERSEAHEFWIATLTILRVVAKEGDFWVGTIVKHTLSKRFDKVTRQQEQF
jgi:hypothetical protein